MAVPYLHCADFYDTFWNIYNKPKRESQWLMWPSLDCEPHPDFQPIVTPGSYKPSLLEANDGIITRQLNRLAKIEHFLAQWNSFLFTLLWSTQPSHDTLWPVCNHDTMSFSGQDMTVKLNWCWYSKYHEIFPIRGSIVLMGTAFFYDVHMYSDKNCLYCDIASNSWLFYSTRLIPVNLLSHW